MGQMDYNIKGFRTFTPMEKVLKKSEEVVEETILKGTEEIPQNQPEFKGIKMDPLQYLERVSQDMVPAAKPKSATPKGEVVIDEDNEPENIQEENNIFECNKKGVTRSGESGLSYDELVSQWNSLGEDVSYTDKDTSIVEIIKAAMLEGRTDEANEWRCYRFIMRNRYRQQMYEKMLRQIQLGASYEDIIHDPEFSQFININVDITRYFWGEDEEDFRTTNPIIDENGSIIGYEYDDEGFQYFGGVTVWDDENGTWIYDQSETTPRSRFLYNEAMIESFKAKAWAILVKLQDRSLSPDSIDKLRRDFAEYHRILNTLLAEQKTLAVQLGYMNQTQTSWNTTTYQWTDPNHGLVPGLNPPPLYEVVVHDNNFQVTYMDDLTHDELVEYYNGLVSKYLIKHMGNVQIEESGLPSYVTDISNGAGNGTSYEDEPYIENDDNEQIQLIKLLIIAAQRLFNDAAAGFWRKLLAQVQG